MINGRLARAARTRLARLRGRGGEADSGFALIFVLLVSMVITAAVATTVAVTVPNITNAKRDQDAQAAVAAAESGIDDVVAYLTSVNDCRSTTKVCDQALGASSAALHRTPLDGTGESVTWKTDPTVTTDGYVRVHSTGTSGGATRTLVGDIALAPSILSFGYYTDYETQSPGYLYGYFTPRNISLTNSSTYDNVNATDSRGRRITVSSPTTAHWNGPATTGTNPQPASICGQHWYYESPSSPGRYTFGNDSLWGETGSIGSSSLTRTSSCDVVFTTGMTLDGPVYTRDALLISDATVGGKGPIFNQPVMSLWGFTGDNTPAAGTKPWRVDDSAGGNISASSKIPTTAPYDLQLPTDIGSTGLPANRCIYTGPTRVKLNGDGTATVTSPKTLTRAATSDAGCYPLGSLAGGVINFTLNYNQYGTGAIYVQNSGTKPSGGWPDTNTKSTVAATANNSVFYLPASGGGAATPDQPDTSVAPSSTCSSSVKYKTTASWPCAWTNVATTTDGGGWTSYSSSTQCNSGTLTASNEQLFACDYSNKTTGTPTKTYNTLRTAFQNDLATSACVTAAACQTLLTGELSGANSNNATPQNGDHRYVVTSSAGSSTAGTPQSVGAVPTTAVSGDRFFTTDGNAAQEAATKTPITLSVARQTYGCVNGAGSVIGSIVTLLNGLLGCLLGSPGWGNTTAQFAVTVTASDWSITAQASGKSYFPNVNDVTQYSTGTSGAAGTDGPGDLYVEGNNAGKLSLIAQNDVVVTGDIKDTAPADAVDIVAGQNVRNFHPVSCADQTAADIGTVTPETGTAPGYCPNDITGLYRGASGMESNGVLTCAHPAAQYVDMAPVATPTPCSTSTNRLNCPSSPGGRQIDAAVFALSGSLLTDNYNRGCALGRLQVNGGLYQSHRGANGVQWEFQTSDSKRATSGYSLQYHYVDLQHSGLPYAPPATGGSNTRIWSVVSISNGSGS